MGNLCICCYVRRDNLKSQFSYDDVRQGDGNVRFLPKLEWTPEKESVSPTIVNPKTPSLTSSDVSSSILNSQTASDKPVHKAVLRVRDGLTISRALSAPVLQDVPDIIVTDNSSSSQPGEELRVSSATDSFVMPSSMDEVSKTDRSPSASPTPSRWSDCSTKSRQESVKEVLNTIAAVGIASSILDSRKANKKSKNKEKNLKNFKLKSTPSLRNNQKSSKEEKRSHFDKDKKWEKSNYMFGQNASHKNIGKKKR